MGRQTVKYFLFVCMLLVLCQQAFCQWHSDPDLTLLPEATPQKRISATLTTHTIPREVNSLATPEVVAWLEKLIRRNLPENYSNDKKWGKQKEVWDGIKLRREGLKIETKRKKKLVNAGTWTKYSISLVKPDEQLFIQFNRLEALPDGRIAFGVTVDCMLDVFGRLSQWVRDVQIISLSANADAGCRLYLSGTVQFKMNLLKFPPDVSLKPQVDEAHVTLTHYRVRRISQIGGDFAKVLGNGLRRTVDEKLEETNAKLVGKINKQLEKHEDKLSFSAQDWLKSKLPMPKSVSGENTE